MIGGSGGGAIPQVGGSPQAAVTEEAASAEAADTARLARECSAVVQAVTLARWVEERPRQVTPVRCCAGPMFPRLARCWVLPSRSGCVRRLTSGLACALVCRGSGRVAGDQRW